MKVSDKLRWHIAFREKRSKIESFYIYSLIKYFERELGESYSSLLDVCCGNGRLHPFLREFGLEVFGVDKSKELLQEAKRRNPQFKNNYWLADVRNFKLNKKFDVALSWFTSFGYYDDKTNLQILKNISNHLRKRGLFILDIPNASGRICKLNPILVQETSSILEICRNEVKFDKGKPFWTLRMKFYKKKGENLLYIGKYFQRVRLYFVPEISEMLNRAGFKPLRFFKSLSFDEVRLHTPQMVVVSVKK